MSHTDLTAIVTGAASTRGIGRVTAHALAADGWIVAILDLDEGGPSMPPTTSPTATAYRPSAWPATSPTSPPWRAPWPR